MDKPSVWRAVVSSTEPRRPRSESGALSGGGAHADRPSSAMSYRLYDMAAAALSSCPLLSRDVLEKGGLCTALSQEHP
ncbi:hypothetical protein UPYG_G00014000 [Umbra pygmaea]|uniref:Uncharacterized protein n=1 Tax=Umbra pygmaea TaxID=75934 RepID=A0ABD0Y6K6_UMBPY